VQSSWILSSVEKEIWHTHTTSQTLLPDRITRNHGLWKGRKKFYIDLFLQHQWSTPTIWGFQYFFRYVPSFELSLSNCHFRTFTFELSPSNSHYRTPTTELPLSNFRLPTFTFQPSFSNFHLPLHYRTFIFQLPSSRSHYQTRFVSVILVRSCGFYLYLSLRKLLYNTRPIRMWQ
jgi:hypothetical protein